MSTHVQPEHPEDFTRPDPSERNQGSKKGLCCWWWLSSGPIRYAYPAAGLLWLFARVHVDMNVSAWFVYRLTSSHWDVSERKLQIWVIVLMHFCKPHFVWGSHCELFMLSMLVLSSSQTNYFFFFFFLYHFANFPSSETLKPAKSAIIPLCLLPAFRYFGLFWSCLVLVLPWQCGSWWRQNVGEPIPSWSWPVTWPKKGERGATFQLPQ